jgi:hypothetical protein
VAGNAQNSDQPAIYQSKIEYFCHCQLKKQQLQQKKKALTWGGALIWKKAHGLSGSVFCN